MIDNDIYLDGNIDTHLHCDVRLMLKDYSQGDFQSEVFFLSWKIEIQHSRMKVKDKNRQSAKLREISRAN